MGPDLNERRACLGTCEGQVDLETELVGVVWVPSGESDEIVHSSKD